MSLPSPILRIALPSIVTNITVPLLSLADTAIAGHLGAASYIGAIAIGGMVFNMIYWVMGFLRMGTGGLTAQACGAKDNDESLLTLVRSLCVAGGVALLLIVLQSGIWAVASAMVGEAGTETSGLAREYFSILIWGAPAVLGLYSLTGWFLGMQNARYPMYISIVQNVVNIAVSLFLVAALRWRVAGVACGTLVAQYAGFLLALYLWNKRYRSIYNKGVLKRIGQRGVWKRFFTVNRDIFLRTLCLVAVSTAFTVFGTALGENTLAANALLMQFFVLFSYVMDGFAYAGEALGGKYAGACDRQAFVSLTRDLFKWGAAFTLLFTGVYALGGTPFLHLLTDEGSVIATAANYLPWACLIPVVSVSAFLFDGLFIGTTATRQMLLSMLFATAGFFLLRTALPPTNAALWSAFLIYLGLRGIMQAVLFRSILRRTFNTEKSL